MEIHRDIEQGSPEWYAIRAGRPTSSEFSKLVTTTGKPSSQIGGMAAQLAANLYAGEDLEAFQGNKWTDRGTELEPDARAFYEFRHDLDVEQVGFITNFEAGCSPDGLVGEDGGCEIKCLNASKHTDAFIKMAEDGKPPMEFYAQVQGSLMIAERDWWDLCLYHPKLPWIELRITPDEKFQQILFVQLKEVILRRNEILAEMEARR